MMTYPLKIHHFWSSFYRYSNFRREINIPILIYQYIIYNFGLRIDFEYFIIIFISDILGVFKSTS